jgi:hypothetical protein
MDKQTQLARAAVLKEATGSIQLGKQTYPIKFGFKQIQQFERLAGVSTIHLSAMMARLSADTVIKGLWVLMREQDPKITEGRIFLYLYLVV